MGLVFYDTETTGTDTAFDQILQFASIQTDENLKVIDKFESRCRLLPHVVPSPGAMAVTGLKASQLTDPSLPSHYKMVRAISEKMHAWSPALFVGWNSVDFDERLIRQAFYMTLHNPYLTSREGNSRSDVMRIVQACSLFAPNALNLPTGPNGRIIFKLDQVAPANGFKHDRAHDAMGDVEATIFLCRLIMERAPEVWSTFMRFSTKAAVTDYIKEESVFCMTDFYFGKPYSWMVTTIGQNPQHSAECYVYNLDIHPNSLSGLPNDELAIRLQQPPKPVRRLKTNAAPMLFPHDDAPKICQGKDCGLDQLQERADILKGNPALCERLISALESRKEPYPTSPHVESQLYERFFEKPDVLLMENFHSVPWHERPAIVEKFQDERLKKIGWRLIYIEHPEVLHELVRREQEVALARRLIGLDESFPCLTIPKALQEIEAISINADTLFRRTLHEHEEFLRSCQTKALTVVSV